MAQDEEEAEEESFYEARFNPIHCVFRALSPADLNLVIWHRS